MNAATGRGRRSSTWRWLGMVAEASIAVASVVYLVRPDVWSLLVWLGLGTAYLFVGLGVVWRGRALPASGLRGTQSWSWVLSLLAGLAGANSAVIALAAKGSTQLSDKAIAGAASVGVAMSWALLQVGFAQAYRALDARSEGRALRFPDTRASSMIDFLYFGFTVGTSFATSDVEVCTSRVRRVVLVHSVIAFFYNALVVAVAFQVLQQLVSG